MTCVAQWVAEEDVGAEHMGESRSLQETVSPSLMN
jgi:hypothetical protein